jgi:superfamily II DNA/RNA helicase
MSITSIKRQNHRAHPCKSERKNELLNILLTSNADSSILVVTANDPSLIQNSISSDNVVIISDTALAEKPELLVDLLISYDLPLAAEDYITRLSHTKTHALILLDESEQKDLYPIETLVGRTVIQEVIIGFEPDKIVKEAEKTFKPREFKRDDKPRQKNYDQKREYKSSGDDKRKEYKPRNADDAKREYKPRNADDAKKEYKPKSYDSKEKSRYVGKDENGKAMFSGKTRERNHGYDGKPKSTEPARIPKKINIKSMKPKKESSESKEA